MKILLLKYMLIVIGINCVAEKLERERKGYNCKYSCGNYIKFVEDNITTNAIEKHNVKVTFSFVEDFLPIYIMSREKYWQVIEHNYGPKAKSIGRKFIHPEIEEARQWSENKKCKIGRICAPNSDCWGSWSEYCYSDAFTDWVTEKSFQYLNMWWTTEWRETCTMDWECKILQKKVPIHYNSEGEMFIVIDDEKIKIEITTKDLLIHKKLYNVYIPKIPRESSMTVNLNCFKVKEDLLCEGANEEMIKFDRGTKCTVLGSSKYCLVEGEFNRIRDFGANQYASISDLNQVRDAFVVNQERDNYNNYVISLKIRKLQRMILDLISSLSDKNPQILNNVLKGNYYTRHLTDWTYEVCACNNVPSCDEREFHSENVKFCGLKVNANKLSLFDINKTIDFSLDDVFRFQGKDTHIVDILMEEEEKGSEFSIKNSSKSFWQGLTDSINPFSWFSSSVGYIALIVSILAYLKR